MSTFLARILGANWQTTVSMLGGVIFGFITWLSTLSYDQGGIALIIPVEYKPYVTKLAAIASLALLAWNAIQQKSRGTVGGWNQQTMSGGVADAGTQTLVDATVKGTIASNEQVTPEQRQKANS